MSVCFYPGHKPGHSAYPEWLELQTSIWNAGYVFQLLDLPPDTESVGRIEHWRLIPLVEQLLDEDYGLARYRARLALIVGWCIGARHDLCWS